jgi:hypothetical protein
LSRARDGRAPYATGMADVIGGLAAVLAVLLLVGAVTGRVRARSCCTLVADPEHDLRMRDAAAPPVP